MTTWGDMFDELDVEMSGNAGADLARAITALYARSKEQKKLSDTLLAEVEQLKSRVRMLTEGPA